MRITKRQIKEEFLNAEKDLDYCWNVLSLLKTFDKSNAKEAAEGLIHFQEKLATLILKLNKTRTQLLSEEKETIKNKVNYNQNKFVARLRLLASYKKGIDSVVNISKALGDAFAYFFYRHNLELFEEHLSHQRVINSAAGIGEIGEVEFLKRIKQFEGNFTLYHGITNILRYGDYSFINLSKLQVIQIGELKTKHISENKLQFNLTLLQPNKQQNTSALPAQEEKKAKTTRKERQLEDLIGFITSSKQDNLNDFKIHNKSYFNEIEALYKEAKNNKVHLKKVSDGLAFSLVKFRKSTLFNKLFVGHTGSLVEKYSATIIKTATQLLKSDSKENSIILGQILYDSDFLHKNTRGTAPFFWYPLSLELLRKLYFLEANIISVFNPIHLISNLETLGFAIESKYIDNSEERLKEKKHLIQNFDLFISYIIHHLLTENFVIDSLEEVLRNKESLKGKKVILKTHRHVL